MQVIVARLSQESRRWARKEGRELKPTVERSESGARGEIHSPPLPAEQRKRAKWG